MENVRDRKVRGGERSVQRERNNEMDRGRERKMRVRMMGVCIYIHREKERGIERMKDKERLTG